MGRLNIISSIGRSIVHELKYPLKQIIYQPGLNVLSLFGKDYGENAE